MKRKFFFDQILHEADSGGNEGGSQLTTELLEKFQKLVEKNGGENAAAQLLYKDNYELRKEIRDLKAKVPVEGAFVLSTDDSKLWSAYQTLGAPDALTTAIESARQAQGELEKVKRSQTIRDVSEIVGFKPGVLSDLDTLAGGLVYEVKAETKDGKTANTVYVKGGKAVEPIPLANYAQTYWADHLPALVALVQQNGTKFVAQGTGKSTSEQTSKAAAQGALDKMYGRKKDK